jgi:hypothetical protein
MWIARQREADEGLRAGRRQNRSGGSILGEKAFSGWHAPERNAVRATLEWLPLEPDHIAR